MSPLPEPAGPEPAERIVNRPPNLTDRPQSPMAPVPPPASPSSRRLIIAILLGAGVAALGGLILGEYPFTGVTPYIAGVLFALVVAEVIVSVSRRSAPVTAVAAAVCTVGGLGWAVWISAGEGIDPIPVGGWIAVVIGAVVALLRGGIRGGASPGPSSQHPS